MIGLACVEVKNAAIRMSIPHQFVQLLAVGEGYFFDLEQIFFFFLPSGQDWLADGDMVLVESGGDIMLECVLSWSGFALTGELGTVVKWVAFDWAISRPDVLTKFKPVVDVPALVMGLDGTLCVSKLSAVPTLALELIFSGLLAVAS